MIPPMNRTSVTIRVGCRASLTQDVTARRPEHAPDLAGTSGTAKVQWVERTRARQSMGHSGDEPDSETYFLLTTGDLTALQTSTAATLAKGDQVTHKAGVALPARLYVTEIRGTGHQQSHGGHTLWQVFLSDRSP